MLSPNRLDLLLFKVRPELTSEEFPQLVLLFSKVPLEELLAEERQSLRELSPSSKRVRVRLKRRAGATTQ